MTPASSNRPEPEPARPFQKRRGLSRLWHAMGFSLAGLRAGWSEPAFRQEAMAAFVLIPAAFWIGADWPRTALLIGSVVLVLVVELLNTAIEAAIDRIGYERHALSGQAKDMGSAAVLLSLLLAAGIWAAAIWERLAR
jgi:diacylglycerol kinase (ATP)